MSFTSSKDFLSRIIDKYGTNYKSTYYWKSSGQYTYGVIIKFEEKQNKKYIEGVTPTKKICSKCNKLIKANSKVKKFKNKYFHFNCV